MNVAKLAAFITRAAVLAALWWAWLGGEHLSWILGGPAVFVGAFVSLEQLPPLRERLSMIHLIILFPKLALRALLGGSDVASRVLSPHLNVSPTLMIYPITLERSVARWFFLHCVSLLPGTLSASVEGDEAVIHVLADEERAIRELHSLETDIARVLKDPSSTL